jgi:hypothetical protein
VISPERHEALVQLAQAGLSLEVAQRHLADADEELIAELLRFVGGNVVKNSESWRAVRRGATGEGRTMITLPSGVTKATLARAIEAAVATAINSTLAKAGAGVNPPDGAFTAFSEFGDQVDQVAAYARSIRAQCEAGGVDPGRIITAFRHARASNPALTAKQFIHPNGL